MIPREPANLAASVNTTTWFRRSSFVLYLALSILSLITLIDAFKRGNLVPLSVPHRNFERQFYLILHKDKYKSAGILSWLELCQKHV